MAPKPQIGIFNCLPGTSTGMLWKHLKINTHNFRLTIFLQNQLLMQRQKPGRHPRLFLLSYHPTNYRVCPGFLRHVSRALPRPLSSVTPAQRKC